MRMESERDDCPLVHESMPDEAMELLLNYTARRLGAEERHSLEHHMAGCDACSSFLDQQAEVWDALDVWKPGAVSADFNRRLWQRIDAERGAPWYTGAGFRIAVAEARREFSLAPALSVAFALLFAAGGFVLDHPAMKQVGEVSARAGSPPIHVSALEAEQVARTLDDIQLLGLLDSAPAGPAPSARKM